MTPLDFEPPRMRSDLENRAFAIAERATNWANQQTDGKTPSWDDTHPAHQIGVVLQVITYLSIRAVVDDPTAGAH